ncbi:MAG: GNAT family N-acetyltransferase [Anaerolineales bacterium]|nr:MAG: GNAT family N-acetyltransferase [Anaerolineales bacterium]
MNCLTAQVPHLGTSSITFRPGTVADSYPVFEVFERTLADLSRRLGSTKPTSASDPAALARMWEERRSLYEHLARTAEHFWLAERDGQLVGFSRSILRGGVRELTELFVLPGEQSSGLGRELLARSFPADGAAHRSIIASADFRAQALYLKTGVYPRFLIYYFGRAPESVRVSTDLSFEPITALPDNLKRLGELDEVVLGHRRDVDHAWLLTDRQGYLYYRSGRPVGYGYLGVRNGPFALLDARDYPAVLAHAESQAAAQGRGQFGLEVATVNQAAVDYLLARSFRIDSFMAVLMNDTPFGTFENYIFPSPPFFL